MSSPAKAGDILPLRIPDRFSIGEGVSSIAMGKNHENWWKEAVRLVYPDLKINAGIEMKKEIKMEKHPNDRRPLRAEITQGENGYMVTELYVQPGRQWFALNAEQLGKLLVKLAKAAAPLSKV